MKNEEITRDELIAIERFLRHEMSREERADFLARMEEDPQMANKIKEVRMLLAAVEEAAMEEEIAGYHREMTELREQDHPPVSDRRSAPPQFRRARFIPWSVAAAVLALFSAMLWYLLPGTGNHKNLYATYYKPDPGLMTVMSAPEEHYDFERAMVAYKDAEYPKAIATWERQLRQKPGNDTLNYFLGAAWQASGDLSQARAYLLRVAGNPNSAFYKEANWYMALISLREQNIQEARLYLEKTDHSRKEALIRALES